MKNSKTKLFLLDIDGCLADPLAPLRQALGLPAPARYDLEDWGEHRKRALELLRDPGFLGQAPPVPGAREFLRELAKRGWGLIYATARPKRSGESTLAWLAHHGFPGGVLLFAEDKAQAAKEVGASWALEDAPAQIAALAASGVRVLVPDWPYARKGAEGVLLFPRWRWEKALRLIP